MSIPYSQKNIEQLYELIGKVSGQPVVHGDYFDVIQTSHSIWPNQIYNLNAGPQRIREAVKRIESEDFPAIYMSNPANDKAKTIAFLKGCGFRNTSWRAMSHDMRNIPEYETPPEFSNCIIQDQEEFICWKDLVEETLMGGEKLNREVFEELAKQDAVSCFLAYWEGDPVGCSLLFTSDEQAGLYLIGTKEPYRKRGIGRSITQSMMQAAVGQGVLECHLQATASGAPVYSKLGFEDRGQIEVFNLRNKGV